MPRPVTQTITHGDPKRFGNCFAACVATALDRDLRDVPHFVEWGQWMHNGKQKDDQDGDRNLWWAMFYGYCFGLGVTPTTIASPDDAIPGELVFVAGTSPRGVTHQVLYRDGELWHDPHPSRGGLTAVFECFVLRDIPASGHDHDPTNPADHTDQEQP